MNTLTRRTFLEKSALAAGATLAARFQPSSFAS
ncbi:MAG: twin-arginine translocation signal domain-containing protein, partial [Verrucomicrobia bacterium]|nr:twin-arginine translocation signal domain-containing protein [Verrucomicrobiota bacterium]